MTWILVICGLVCCAHGSLLLAHRRRYARQSRELHVDLDELIRRRYGDAS